MLFILLGAVLPLLIVPGLLFHYDTTPKTLVIEFTAVMVLMNPAALAAGLIRLWSRPAGRWLVRLAVLQVAWFGVATGFSRKPWFSVFGSAWRQFGLTTMTALTITVLAAAGELCRKPDGSRRLLKAVALAGILASVYGIFQYFDIDPFQDSGGYHDHAGDSVIVRPPGPLGHADFFGWWLVVGVFCAFALAKAAPGKWRAIGAAALVIQLAGTVITGTRAALLALLVGTVVSGIRPRVRNVIAAGACVAVFAGFLFSAAGTRLRARIQWSREEPVGGARPLLWRDSLRMAAAKPLSGYGPETFTAAFLTWQSEELARVYPDVHQESPHNVALDALTSAGWPGFGLTLAWGGLAIYAARHSRFQGPLVAAAAASAVAGMFTAAMLAPVLLTLLAIALLIAEDSPDGQVRAPATVGWARTGSWAARACAVALTAHGVALAAEDFALARFERRPDVRSYEAYRRVRLPGAAEDLYCSRALGAACRQIPSGAARLECSRVAIQTAARATSSADDPANAWYNLAIFTAGLNDWNGTDNALKTAIQIAPNWFKPHWMRARLLQLRGDRGGATAEAGRAATLANNRYPEVNLTVEQLTK